MDNANNLGYLKLAAALVLSLLMAPSPAVAEREYLNQYTSDKYLRLGYNMKELRQQSEGESLSGSETDSAQPASDDAWQISTMKLSQQSEGESLSGSETDSAQPASDDDGQVSAKELSQQSANPVGKMAFVFTQFAATFNDGDLNTGDSHLAGNITFQPIIPIPLYGSGDDEWRIVTRPTINLNIEQPVPDGEVNIIPLVSRPIKKSIFGE